MTPPPMPPDVRAAVVAWLRAEARGASPVVRSVLATLALRLAEPRANDAPMRPPARLRRGPRRA
jgi:hypothetical protein